jgi:hypothetical protein
VYKYGVSISSTVHSIFNGKINFQMACSQVLRILTQEHNEGGAEVCRMLIHCLKNEGEEFLKHVVTCDGNWIIIMS